MSLQVEKLEKNMAKLTIEVPAEELEAAIEKAYQKNKGKIQIPGFRKGKVPRKMIEQMYGKEFFYEDAANEVIPEAYEKAKKQSFPPLRLMLHRLRPESLLSLPQKWLLSRK